MPGLVKLRVSVIWNCFVPHCHSPHTATGGGASVTPCLPVTECSLGGDNQRRTRELRFWGEAGAPWTFRITGRAGGAQLR